MESILKAYDVGITYVECDTEYELCAALQMALNNDYTIEYQDTTHNFLIDFNRYQYQFRSGKKIIRFRDNAATIHNGQGISSRVPFKDWFKVQLVTIAEVVAKTKLTRTTIT